MNQAKIKRYPYLLFHLVFSVCILGSFFIYIVNLPFLLLSRLSRRAWMISGSITLWGLHSLRFFQPWWRGDLSVDLPQEVRAGKVGCLCVANHRSHMDVFLLLELIKCIRILTKDLIFLIPGLGGAAYLLRMIRVKRGHYESFWNAMETLEKALKQKEIVHVFPEMTRASFGQIELARFTLAPFQKALQVGVPIVPIVIWGTDYLWPKGVYGIASRGPLVVKSLDPVDSRQFQTAAELSEFVKTRIQDEVNQLNQLYPYGGNS